jgi:predicted SPOUT superfamily RNA methylase MTH1
MLTIAIPSSALINETDPKIKTFKVGLIARACAIFRVEKILVYRDPLLNETEFIKEVLEYAETPQYLRKYIPIKRSLRYVGVLPPLKIPSHKPKVLKVGEIREGFVVKVAPDGTRWVDVGLNALASLRSDVKRGVRVTVRVCSKKPLVVEEVKPKGYWGYKVDVVELKDVLSLENVVVTSKRGRVPELKDLRRDDMTLVFGNPKEGVFEIAKRLGLNVETECWNTIPMQGVKTVRLEEAIYSTLSLINYARWLNEV